MTEPIVFTVTQSPSRTFTAIKTGDYRAEELAFNVIKTSGIEATKEMLVKELGNRGYAVEFVY